MREFGGSLVPVEPFSQAPNYIPEAQARISRFLNDVDEWQWDQIASSLLSDLNAIRTSKASQLEERVTEILARQRQRLLNLMRYAVDQFAATATTTDPLAQSLAASLQTMVASDPNSGSGLTNVSLCALNLVLLAFASYISKELTKGDLTPERLRVLFKDGEGAAIAARAMLAPIYEKLGIPLAELGPPFA